MRKYIICTYLILSFLKSNAQFNVALELGGKATYYSIHAEKIYSKPEKNLAFLGSIGIGIAPIPSQTMLMQAPVYAGLLVGKSRHKLEIGIGCTWSRFTDKRSTLGESTTNRTLSDTKINQSIASFLCIGYRFLPKSESWYLKVLFTPTLALYQHTQWKDAADARYQHWVGDAQVVPLTHSFVPMLGLGFGIKVNQFEVFSSSTQISQ